MIGDPTIFQNDTIDWRAFATGYRVNRPLSLKSPLIGEKFKTPMRVLKLKKIQLRESGIWYGFELSTDTTMQKWFKVTECELCS